MLLQFISNLFESDEDDQNLYDIVIQINDKVSPLDRRNLYMLPLNDFLTENHYGEISGGGILKEEPGEIIFCDIHVKFYQEEISKAILNEIINFVEICGAPKGSKVIIEKTHQEIPFGKNEGIAIYFDGKNSPEKDQQDYDVDFVQAEISKLTNTSQERYWKGNATTGLYFYGKSFDKMKDNVSHFMHTYPLYKTARIAQIA
ncbi:hypothetical protein FLA105534_00924 [Flavobacterium bizetiae]|uniref:Uncharacterized protein n=1 Tax=Flavobacterium bizetiae TaxID=2704140 RepID=A0A6J4GA16_9FLAO|nr:hypothetical protein [Flavobacterium bizetiae]CAA9196031.1 hypothetical protein FLA105534_00924 [Flavobacterium bizetiae]CAD5341486.1 hypothetical protein FLA105535_01460 [Flavobacterium bizetiae]CAD5347953.1 hypothetical protein FLA105534_01912 [Flavobacterium bizetiae]